MADPIEALPERVHAIECKLDGLAFSVEVRFDAVDRRFAAVDARFTAVDARFDAVDARFDAVDARLDAVDARLDAVDRRFDALTASMDRRFDEVTSALVEQRQYTEFAFDRISTEMRAGFAGQSTNFERLERKVDQLVDRLIGRTPDAEGSAPSV